MLGLYILSRESREDVVRALLCTLANVSVSTLLSPSGYIATFMITNKVIGHGGLLPDVLGMSRGFTLRHAQTIKDLGFDMQFNAKNTEALSTAPLSSGRIVLKSHSS